MKFTVKKLCCLIPALSLLICIIIMPALWFTISDRHLYADNHPLSKVDFSLSSEISNIPLVYRIHKLLGSYYSEEEQVVADAEAELEITLTSNEGNDTEEKSYTTEPPEWKELTQYENLNRIIEMMFGEGKVQCVLQSSYDTDDAGMVDVRLVFENEWEAQYIYDTESQKILRLSLPKIAGKQLDTEGKKKAMEEFIAYLNLDILEDWYDNGDSMISNKAHVSLSFQENEKQWILGFSIV